MRVFVTGATGYIGNAVAKALSRAGHEVHGMARTQEKARDLRRAEIIPVIGSMQDPDSYAGTARNCHVAIHCAAEYSAEYFNLDRRTVEALLNAKPGLFIYTSGIWVYGNTGSALVDESTPPNPPQFLTPRVEHEGLVLAANTQSARTMVIRPGSVYGGSGGMAAAWFETGEKAGAAQIVGDGNFRWTTIHVEDLAEFYLRAAESPWSGELFNATDRSRFTVRENAETASRAAGVGGRIQSVTVAEAAKTLGPQAECLTYNQHVDSRKAVRMLGWQPRHGGFADNAEMYHQAWKSR